jgi:hypothetical protein
MNRLAVIVLIILAQCVAGQNYQNVCSSGVTFFYNYLPQNILQAFRPDSMVLLPNLDTLFISYPAVHDTGAFGTCFDTTNGSVFGRKVLRRTASGQFLFFNRHGDTLTFQTQAGLNQSWTMMHLAGGNYIQAIVTSIAQETFLNVNDMVKTISFQAKNPAGNNITHPFNTKTVKLSQQYGFVTFFQVYYAPEIFANVNLAGKQSPPVGVQRANASDLFNFQVGDEFHYSGYYSLYDNASGVTQWLEIRKIIGRTDYPDTIVYLADRCRRETWDPSLDNTSIHDTITEIYPLADPFFSSLPDHFLREAALLPGRSIPKCISRVTHNGRLTKIRYPDAFCCSPCWSYATASSFDNNEEYYTDGLGRTRFYQSASHLMIMTYLEELMYFHKGNETWGTPVSTDCNTLVGIQPNYGTGCNKIVIKPNPASSILTIDLKIEKDIARELIIYSIPGKEMVHLAVSTGEEQIHFNVISWPRGMYIVKVIGQDTNFRHLVLY